MLRARKWARPDKDGVNCVNVKVSFEKIILEESKYKYGWYFWAFFYKTKIEYSGIWFQKQLFRFHEKSELDST